MTSNVRSTFNVGDTTRVVYNKYWARQIEMEILNKNFCVASYVILVKEIDTSCKVSSNDDVHK